MGTNTQKHTARPQACLTHVEEREQGLDQMKQSRKIVGMKCRFALLSCAIFTFGFTSPAFAVDTSAGKELQVSRLGDVEMSCGALSREALSMREVEYELDLLKDDAEMQGYGVSAVTGIGGFLIGTVTGGIGFAAAGLLANEAITADAEEAEALQDVASQRKSLMMGIFKAKGCYGPIEHVMQQVTQEPETREALADIEPASGYQYRYQQTHYND